MLYNQSPSPAFYISDGYDNDNVSQTKMCDVWLTGKDVLMGIIWYLNLKLSPESGPPDYHTCED